MTISVVERLPIAAPRKSVVGLARAFFARLPARTVKLDLEVMPDRVKRDLGLLDGCEPRYQDKRLR